MKYFKSLLLSIAIFFLLLSSGCQESDTASDKKPAETSTSTSKLIDTTGGKVILSTNDIIASAEIPPDSLPTPEKISISLKNPLPGSLPEGYTPVGDCVNFGPEGIIFQKKVILGLPFNSFANIKKSSVQVKYYDPISGKWTDMPVKNVDTNNLIVYFETNHFQTI